MRIQRTDNGYLLTKEDGQEFTLTFFEAYMVESSFRKEGWRSEIEEEIDMLEDSISFEQTSRAEFVDEVIDALNDRFEEGYSFDSDTVHYVVEGYITDYGMWRDE